MRAFGLHPRGRVDKSPAGVLPVSVPCQAVRSLYRPQLRPYTSQSAFAPKALSGPQDVQEEEFAPASIDIVYRCPTCTQPLREKDGGMLVCESGHTVLCAKEGYVHLRPSGRKAAANSAGDSPEMVKARRIFFDAGHYDFIADELGRLIAEAAGERSQVSLLDAGCGEGMYITRVQASLQQAGMDCAAFGVDVSKTAIRMGAKRHRGASFAVASSYVLPFDNQVFDAVICVFAPVAAEEFARVIRAPGGILVVAHPGSGHLMELKRLLYKQPKLFSEDSIRNAEMHSAGFELMQTVRVKRELVLPQNEALYLLAMTPYFWHAPQSEDGPLLPEGDFTTTVEVLLTAFRRM